MTDAKVELRPLDCPFCGSKAELYSEVYHGKKYFNICCLNENCFASAGDNEAHWNTSESVMKAWNKRSPSPQTQKQTCIVCNNPGCKGNCLRNIYPQPLKQPMHPDTIDWNDGARLAQECLNKHIHASDCNIYASMSNGGDNDGICDCGYGRNIFRNYPEKKFEEGVYYSKERLSSEPVPQKQTNSLIPLGDKMEVVK